MPLPLTDLSSQPVDEADARFAELADQHVSAVFDLATGPVMRAILVKMPADEHRLVLSLHHIAADGWSMGVLSGELAELYETETLIGFFANTVVLRADLAGNPTAGELVRRMHETVVDAQNYQDLPFGHVVDELRPERDAGRNPLFQVSFTLQNSATTGSAQL